MIIDRLENASRYFPLNPRFEAAFRFLAETDLATLPVGSTELDGPSLRVNLLQGPAKTRDTIKLEAHRQFIDIQLLLSGQEQFGWKLTSACTQAAADYDPVQDLLFYSDAPDAWFPSCPACSRSSSPRTPTPPCSARGNCTRR